MTLDITFLPHLGHFKRMRFTPLGRTPKNAPQWSDRWFLSSCHTRTFPPGHISFFITNNLSYRCYHEPVEVLDAELSHDALVKEHLTLTVTDDALVVELLA
jgi:hypothetical protein